MDCCSGLRHSAVLDSSNCIGGGRQVRSVVRIAAGGGHFYVCIVGGESGFFHIRYIIFDRVILD